MLEQELTAWRPQQRICANIVSFNAGLELLSQGCCGNPADLTSSKHVMITLYAIFTDLRVWRGAEAAGCHGPMGFRSLWICRCRSGRKLCTCCKAFQNGSHPQNPRPKTREDSPWPFRGVHPLLILLYLGYYQIQNMIRLSLINYIYIYMCVCLLWF